MDNKSLPYEWTRTQTKEAEYFKLIDPYNGHILILHPFDTTDFFVHTEIQGKFTNHNNIHASDIDMTKNYAVKLYLDDLEKFTPNPNWIVSMETTHIEEFDDKDRAEYKHDNIATCYIDGYTADENAEGRVIAKVILTKKGDIAVAICEYSYYNKQLLLDAIDEAIKNLKEATI